MSTEPLLLRQDDGRGLCTLTLNRPEAFNALSEELLAALQAELDQLAQEPELRVVVIEAAGKAFCAGHDLKQMRAEPSLAYYQSLFAHSPLCGQRRQPGPVLRHTERSPVAQSAAQSRL
jgi:enoyl-CoA hydratase/carnithine racemase